MTIPSLDDLGPGLHVVREADPVRRAVSLADALDAELCERLEQAEALLAERRELAAVDLAALATLQTLARRLGRAHRLAARTRERAVTEAGARLTGTVGLAVHPDTVRDRASRLEQARRQLADADAALVDHERNTPTEESLAEPPSADLDGAVEPTRALSLRARRTQAIGAVVVAFGIALVLMAVGQPLWVVLLPPLVASLWALRRLQPSTPQADRDDRAEASSLLSEMGAFTDELFGVRRAVQEHELAGARLTSARSRAEEEVRVAERAWRDLAGEGVDPADVEAIVRRFDPQQEDARLLAEASVSVRGADVALRQLHQQWETAWQELGRQAPDPHEADDAVAQLRRRVTRSVVLVGTAGQRGEDIARAAPAATIVVIDEAS